MKPPRPGERSRLLDNHRARKMARSAHAFVRGNTAEFYEMLAASSAAAHVPSGPAVWICGDCHLGNLGPLSDGDGQVDIQIRDLDQSVIANPAYDLIRLGLSLETAARSSDLPGVTIAHMIESVLARGEHGTLVRGWLAVLADAVRCERHDAAASDAFAAACSVRLAH